MSITERPVSAALKTMLVNNEPIQYAHLIKFERPSRPDSQSGLVSTAKQRYTYLTDASINVDFDDGSYDLNGIANGTQTYLANKVLSVGTIQETTKAAATNTTVVLDGTGLGGNLTFTGTISLVSSGIWDIVLQAPFDLDDIIYQGFREGDKVTVNGIPVNIQGFRGNNDTLRVTKVDLDLTVGTTTILLKLASEEIISILLNKNASDYSSFINREVMIYRAYFRDGVVVGAPVLMFRGIIYSVNFEDSDSAVKVTWGLTSHWGDFAQVRGRVTSDSAHRALNESGVPQPQSALKPIYAYDKGFNHAETSIHVLSKYITKVEKMDVSSKKGFLGIGSGVNVRKYYVDQDNYTQLDFELGAKAIPVIYGCRMTDGIPIFGDTLNSDSSTVYVATVLSEGEIGGIYDITIGGNSLICNDKADYDARAVQTADNTVALICRGRADRGDALGGQILTTTGYAFYDDAGEKISLSPEVANLIAQWKAAGYNLPGYNTGAVQYSNTGIKDGETISLSAPQDFVLDFFSGKSGQKASAQLCDVAYRKDFKIQNNYWKGSDTSEYWGPNHRLLDTAYVVGKFQIAEGETTIPEIKFVIKGKVLDCYNYDYSYSHDARATTESAANFIIGQVVSLYRSDNSTLINSNVQIIDKWTILNPDGSTNTRFRYSDTPALNYDSNGLPTITQFYMQDASNNKWTMLTHNYNYLTGNIAGSISSAVTSVTNSGGYIVFNYASNSLMTIENDPIENSAGFQLTTGTYDVLPSGNIFKGAIMTGTATATSFTSGYTYATYGTEASSVAVGNLLVSKNTVRLPAAASATNDYYKNTILEITRYNSTTGKSLVQTAVIVGYDGTNKIATIDGIFDFIPISSDTFRIYPKYADARVSTNPAIQLLDYTTSKSYGRGLHYTNDLNLPSWLETARKCDTQSNVTMLSTTDTSTVSIGDTYKIMTGSILVWQGIVANKFTSGSSYYIEFTNCIGKPTNQWNSWKTWNAGDVLYNSTYQFFTVNSSGVVATEPTTTAGIVTIISNLSLIRVHGTGPATLALNLSSGNPVQSLRNGSKISGYSLYDCDDIDYWRLSGWDEHAQRYVTKCQTNLMVDTSNPIFDNINSFLEHFNGIMRYTAGKYYLDLEEASGPISTSDIRTITADDIIGKIQLADEGVRSAYNSLTAAFADPANKFEARSISFFNSEYLKADKNVPKKGNVSVPGITNYYNTRLLADSYLNKSRYGLTINMTIRTHGILFLAGTIIQVVYPRYDWTSPGKKFRIDTITYQPDGMADIVAKEYDDSFYGLTGIKVASGTGATTVTGVTNIPSIIPTSVTSTTNQVGQITTTWDSVEGNPAFEVWASNSTTINSASLVSVVYTNNFVETIPDNPSTRYYWIRRRIMTNGVITYSEYSVMSTGSSLANSATAALATGFVSATAYSYGTTYFAGDIVYSQSANWISTQDDNYGTPPPILPSLSNGYWELIGVQGHKYTWIVYANSTDGITFTDLTTGSGDTTVRRWMGIATNKDIVTPSTTTSDYTWTKIS
jgi:hypothetical protein